MNEKKRERGKNGKGRNYKDDEKRELILFMGRDFLY